MKFTWCVIHNRRAQGLKRAMLSAACLTFIGTNLLAQEMANLPEALIEKIEIAKKACSDFEDGQFALVRVASDVEGFCIGCQDG